MKLYGVQTGMYCFLNDHLGTPQSVVSSSGVIVWEAAYLPFGKAWVKTGTVANNFRFPGQYYDEETGLHYNWHRYYNPNTGRYLTPDPIGLEAGINLYSYCINDPANWIDDDGLNRRSGRRRGNSSSYGRRGITEVYVRSLIREIRELDPNFGTIQRKNHVITEEDIEFYEEILRELRAERVLKRRDACPPCERDRGRIKDYEKAIEQVDGLGSAQRKGPIDIERMQKSLDQMNHMINKTQFIKKPLEK